MKKILLTAMLLLSQMSLAGGESVGGGDLCENRIQEIRDDISIWINKGGPKDLEDLPISIEEYSKRMQTYLAVSKNNDGPLKPVAHIECTRNMVDVGKVEKVCRFDRATTNSKIICDYDKFMNASVDEQYRLIHHEYAGLAGIENPNGGQSTYFISNQLTSFLQVQIVRKLALKNQKPATKYEALKELYNSSVSNIQYDDFDLYGATKTKECVETSGQYQDKTFPVMLNKMIKVVDPSGPLFPDSKVTKILLHNGINDMNAMFKRISMNKSDLEIVSLVDYEDMHTDYHFRKNGKYITFYWVYNGPDCPKMTSYGYCYPKSEIN
jgi:hypothetical protein